MEIKQIGSSRCHGLMISLWKLSFVAAMWQYLRISYRDIAPGLFLFQNKTHKDWTPTTEAVVSRCSVIKMFLRLRKIHRNTCTRIPLIKLQTWGLHLYSKKDFATSVSLWISQFFQKYLFYCFRASLVHKHLFIASAIGSWHISQNGLSGERK